MDEPVSRLNAALEGRYHIERQLGEGGMATVYLARDLKHNRNVALKVLKPDLAAVVGADRFLAEIETTANLQHPHILPLFDSGEADSFLFYVMPYVEGESLRERLDREHQLPVDEAVQIAKDVAEALQAAHDQGVIHRDVKPANILLSKGRPLVSDFGIALALGAAGAGRLTETGLSLGTPHYMSPEQATGDVSVGAATDIYALGCVLYEMLTGQPPYTASTPQAILGQIVTSEADPVTKHRKSVPTNVSSAIRKALEKVPADRFGAAQDFAKALADPLFRYGMPESGRGGAGVRPWNGLSVVTTGLALAFGVGFGWLLLERTHAPPPRPVARFESLFRPDQAPVNFGVTSFNLSPDGSMLIYPGPSDEGPEQLWIRQWQVLDAVPIRGTTGGIYPAVSPDGRLLAFVQGSDTKVVPLEGGLAQTLVQSSLPPRWGPDGSFVYVRLDGVGTVRVPVAGGPPEPVTELAEGEATQWISDFLPGGEIALIRVQFDDGRSEIRALRLQSGEMTTLTQGAWPRYAGSGHLLFLTSTAGGGPLMAAPFDPETLEMGAAVITLEDVNQYALSETGDLAYIRAAEASETTQLVWVTRAGDVSAVDPRWRFDRGSLPGNFGWRLSPDGTQVALMESSGGNEADIWVKELPMGPRERITSQLGMQIKPWWTPGGERVMYVSGPLLAAYVWSRSADGTGEASLVEDRISVFQGDYAPDGEWLVLSAGAPTGGRADIVGIRPGVDSVVTELVATPNVAEQDAAVSPDSRWMAYSSDETGTYEVFVRPFPNVADYRVAVSNDGGFSPRWAHEHQELFYVSGTALIAAAFETEPEFRVVERDTLFTIPEDILVQNGANFYDVALDDQRFLMGRTSPAEESGSTSTARYILVQNFLEELRQRVPTN